MDIETRPIDQLEDNCVSFVRGPEYLRYIEGLRKIGVWVFIREDVWDPEMETLALPMFVDDPYYSFIVYHNKVNKKKKPRLILFGKDCDLHPTAFLGQDGLRVGISSKGELVQMKHIGGIVVGDRVDIGPYSVVNRGLFGDTKIGNGVKIGAMCRVGDEAEVGENSILVSRVDVNGGARIGRGCHIQTGTVIANGVRIGDRVVIGANSTVLKDIQESGVYVGSPARFLKPFSEFRRYDGNFHL